MPLKILIVGAGVGGPALAAFLQTSTLRPIITVIERSPHLRTAGQQIDIKGQGVQVMRAAGLLETVRSRCVRESGMEVVDSSGNPVAQFGVTSADGKKSSGGGITQEYEIMRGDLVKVLYEASLERRQAKGEAGEGEEGSLSYEFGKTLTELEQRDDGVDVVFSSGERRRYDLVVAADGQGSRTRRFAFGTEVSDGAFKPFGAHCAFYSIPGLEGESDLAKLYQAPGRRAVMTRTGGRPVTQVYLFSARDVEGLKKTHREPAEKQKEAWAETFADVGWQSERVISGMKSCDDFYVAEGGLVKMDRLFTGRVVLLGESGYGGTFTGVGTDLALVGAYVLAGELARHGGKDVTGAMEAYEKTMRDPIAELQGGPATERTALRVFLPSSQLEIWLLRTIVWAVSKFKIVEMAQWLMPEGKGRWKIPEYRELNLTS